MLALLTHSGSHNVIECVHTTAHKRASSPLTTAAVQSITTIIEKKLQGTESDLPCHNGSEVRLDLQPPFSCTLACRASFSCLTAAEKHRVQ